METRVRKQQSKLQIYNFEKNICKKKKRNEVHIQVLNTLFR